MGVMWAQPQIYNSPAFVSFTSKKKNVGGSPLKATTIITLLKPICAAGKKGHFLFIY